MPPQTSYALDAPIGFPGLIADGSDLQEFVSYPAGEVIPFGRLVELDAATSTKVQLPQQVGQQIAKPVGVSRFDPSRMQNVDAALVALGYQAGYSIGDMVACVRKGRVYAEFSGTTDAALATANVMHSSTLAVNRGKFTDAAGAAGAGVEIADQVGGNPGTIKFVKPINATIAGLCLVEINLP